MLAVAPRRTIDNNNGGAAAPAAPADTGSSGSGATQLKPDPAGDKNIGNGAGKQFITGACLSDADCASTCCAVLGSGGICSGTAVSFAQGASKAAASSRPKSNRAICK